MQAGFLEELFADDQAAGDVSVLNQGEGAVLTRENEVSRLARSKRSAREESDNDSGDEVAASFFAAQIRAERTKAEERARSLTSQYFFFCAVKSKALDIGKAQATYRELYVVQKGQLKRQQVLAKAMSAGACLGELEAIIATTVQQVQCLSRTRSPCSKRFSRRARPRTSRPTRPPSSTRLP